MSISDKIEEIRKKPEHVRMRYVWASVAVTMFFIFIIWLFSLQEIFKSTSPQPEESESFKKSWDEVKKGMPSIEEFIKQGEEEAGENEIRPQENAAPNENVEQDSDTKNEPGGGSREEASQ
jgi:hypothetical protein